MIAYLKGTVRTPGVVVTGGVGYKVVSASPLNVGDTVELDIIALTNRENATTLYGFTTPAQAAVFTALTKVPKIGPAIAIALLRDVGVTGLVAAVSAKDPKALTRAAGVGMRAAESICSLVTLPDIATQEETSAPQHIVDALIALGFPEPAARLAAEDIDPDKGESEQLADAIVNLRTSKRT
jgi:Holliday junction DNA helicase RuvA